VKSPLFVVRLAAILMCTSSLLGAVANFMGGRLTLGFVLLGLAIAGAVSGIVGWVRRHKADDPTFVVSMLCFFAAFATNGIASSDRVTRASGWIMVPAGLLVLVGSVQKRRKRRTGEPAASVAAR
jgi:hypothetical protein